MGMLWMQAHASRCLLNGLRNDPHALVSVDGKGKAEWARLSEHAGGRPALLGTGRIVPLLGRRKGRRGSEPDAVLWALIWSWQVIEPAVDPREMTRFLCSLGIRRKPFDDLAGLRDRIRLTYSQCARARRDMLVKAEPAERKPKAKERAVRKRAPR